MMAEGVQQSTFGSTGSRVTIVGLGGEGVLRTSNRTAEAQAVILQAIRSGITYFDSARVYRDSEVYLGSVWERTPETRGHIFQASKSASRDKAGALHDLQETLQRLHTDHLDLWQIHDVRTMDEVREIASRGGALQAFLEAREAGKVRHIGVTGHHSPKVLTRAVKEWPVDSVMMPVNPVEEHIGGFLTETLPAARDRGIAVIGMKILGASHYILPKFEITPEMLMRFALSRGISVGIVGCSTPEEVSVLAHVGREPRLSEAERKRLLAVFEPVARKLAFYRGVF